mgnify:CR=1 FL=1
MSPFLFRTVMVLLASVSAAGGGSASALAASAAGAPARLLCEGHVNPLGIDAEHPRFSWWVNDDRAGAAQSAYQVEVRGDAGVTWDSGRVASSQSIEVPYAGPALAEGQRYTWRVRTWDSAGTASPWSEAAWFEMGLLNPASWGAQWIGHPPRFTARSVPPVYLRRDFTVGAAVKRARLYITARGLFEAQINGAKVGNDHFVPGWTDYSIRNQYLTYDVTDSLVAGDNAIGIILADGWHNGRLKWGGFHKNWYGQDTSVLARLVIDTADGARHVVVTDGGWTAATGPILESDIYNGEKYDARAELGDWSRPGYAAKGWLAPRSDDTATGRLVAKVVEPVREREVLAARSVRRAANGEWVFDFGQNVVGWARIQLMAAESRTATLRFAEMLNPDGTLYVDNLRTAESTDRYTFKDDKPASWAPRFTFHGFRYVGLSGLDAEPSPQAVEAVVLHSDLRVTGVFACSNELLNQLQSNILWGQKGNYLEVPTDCPQRDERLGWTGDAQVFARTATFNMHVAPFFEKWMADMRDAQQPSGEFPVIVPRLDEKGNSPAWSDAGVICPWVIYERYGNTRILADNLEAMRRWVDFQESSSRELIRPTDGWGGFGDWLAIDAPKDDPGGAPTPKALIGTAYFAHTADLVSRAATVLGRADVARHYAGLRDRVRSAFNREFVRPDGRLKTETQTGYLLALGFDLLPENHRAVAIDALVADLESRGWHLSTGFVGTGLLMPVLSKAGRNDVAWRVLLQESYPGWLYSIRQGATTMWERWNSYTHADGFGPVGMNSFNHYAYGAVGEWMYAVIAGIDALEPGYRKILIRPQPGGGLTWARGRLESPYGLIATDWKVENGTFTLQARVPANTTAVVELPDGTRHEVGAGTHAFSSRL